MEKYDINYPLNQLFIDISHFMVRRIPCGLLIKNPSGVDLFCIFDSVNRHGKTSMNQHIQKIAALLKSMYEGMLRSRFGLFLRNKFVLTSVIFVLWMTFFDQNNLLERRKSTREFRQLSEEKEYYQKKIEEDRKRIRELKTNNDNLEKFAREQYLMKKDNEDIFVIVDED